MRKSHDKTNCTRASNGTWDYLFDEGLKSDDSKDNSEGNDIYEYFCHAYNPEFVV